VGSRSVAPHGDRRAGVRVVSGQAGETFATAKKLANLWTDMLEAAGLLGEE
jgi:hypothetical protein